MYKIIFFALIPVIGLLFEGIRRKLIARFQNRIGPPIVQPFYDIVKLLGKEESSSIGYLNPLFRIIPVFFLVTILALFLFVPFPIIPFEFDFIFLIYLTVLYSAFLILVSVVSNSPFSTLGAMRETILMFVYEITLAVVIITFFVQAGVISFGDFGGNFMLVQLPIATFCLVCVALAEIKITPFDTVEASAEIYSGPLTEFSGKELAILHLGEWMRNAFFIFLISMLTVGTGNWAAFLFLVLLLLFLFPFLRATTNRFRLDQAFSTFIFILALSLLDLIRAVLMR